jgi:CysZ protein
VVLSWILAIQYIDYQADNEQVSLRRMLFLLKHSPLTVFGFGAAVSLALLIPGANLFVPAAAVAGGTALWLSIR